jgi:hypothetical protein
MRSLSEFADDVCAPLQFSKTARVFNGVSISGFTFVGRPGGDGTALGSPWPTTSWLMRSSRFPTNRAGGGNN